MGLGSRYKLINIDQNLFFYVGVNSNLAIEFNGLVSNGVSRNANPFTLKQLLRQCKMSDILLTTIATLKTTFPFSLLICLFFLPSFIGRKL